jgi:polyhydroxybutyrate depolymerase
VRCACVLIAIVAACGNGGAAGDDDDTTGDDAPAGGDAPGGDVDGPSIDAPAVTCLDRMPQPLDAVWTLDHGGMQRSIRVHVPASYDPRTPTPVVFDFHGYTMSAQSQEDLTLLPEKSDEAGFIAVHPDGTGSPRGWNGGDCCGTPASTDLDDVGFVLALLTELDRRLCVDPDRVYATGFSNGGFLSHRLACEAADRFAAIAPVAGVMGLDACDPVRPVPVMHTHGTSDGIVPYNGGGFTGYRSAPATVDDWAARNGCTGEPIETFAQGDARCVSHGGCSGGADVVLCTITGGGHTWPGGGYFPGGHISTDLAVTDAMWDFFASHPR